MMSEGLRFLVRVPYYLRVAGPAAIYCRGGDGTVVARLSSGCEIPGSAQKLRLHGHIDIPLCLFSFPVNWRLWYKIG